MSLYHVSVEFFFAVDVGGASSELQQIMTLVHDQRRVELTHPQQVAAEHPEGVGGSEGGRCR